VDDDTIDYEAASKASNKEPTPAATKQPRVDVAEDDDLATFTKLANDDDDPF